MKANFAEQNNQIASLGEQLESVGEVLHMLKQEQQSLAARVAELEKPRGLRALWHRFFGRRKVKQAERVVA